MKKQVLNEEFRRIQKLAGIITEEQLNKQLPFKENEESGDLLTFVKNNKEEIASLNPEFEDIINSEGVELLTPDVWTEEDYSSAYQGYTYERFMNDWNKFNPTIVVLGDELATVFVTDKPIPSLEFANTVTGNDLLFFGTSPNKQNAFKKYNLNGKNLYIVFGIPDPGS
jgi:hypothetical protein